MTHSLVPGNEHIFENRKFGEVWGGRKMGTLLAKTHLYCDKNHEFLANLIYTKNTIFAKIGARGFQSTNAKMTKIGEFLVCHPLSPLFLVTKNFKIRTVFENRSAGFFGAFVFVGADFS